MRSAYTTADKQQRHKALDAAKAKVLGDFGPEGTESPPIPVQEISNAFKKIEAQIVRSNILDTGRRIDGRDVKSVRPIVSE